MSYTIHQLPDGGRLNPVSEHILADLMIGKYAGYANICELDIDKKNSVVGISFVIDVDSKCRFLSKIKQDEECCFYRRHVKLMKDAKESDILPLPVEDRRIAYIGLYVEPAYRQKGIGQELLDDILENATGEYNILITDPTAYPIVDGQTMIGDLDHFLYMSFLKKQGFNIINTQIDDLVYTFGMKTL